ncbi:MAG: hypothetical protein WBD02_05440 [Acidimicrobiia bacterium]
MKKTIITAIATAGLATSLFACVPTAPPPNPWGHAEIKEASPEHVFIRYWQYPASTGNWPRIRVKAVAQYLHTQRTFMEPYGFSLGPGDVDYADFQDKMTYPYLGVIGWSVYTCIVEDDGSTGSCLLKDIWPK